LGGSNIHNPVVTLLIKEREGETRKIPKTREPVKGGRGASLSSSNLGKKTSSRRNIGGKRGKGRTGKVWRENPR